MVSPRTGIIITNIIFSLRNDLTQDVPSNEIQTVIKLLIHLPETKSFVNYVKFPLKLKMNETKGRKFFKILHFDRIFL